MIPHSLFVPLFYSCCHPQHLTQIYQSRNYGPSWGGYHMQVVQHNFPLRLVFFASYIRDLILCDGCRIILQFRVFKTFSGINTSKMLPKLSSWSLSQVKSVCPFPTRPSWDAYRIFIKWFHELSFVEQQQEARDVEHPKSFQERQKINKRSHWFETRLANKFWHCFVFGL